MKNNRNLLMRMKKLERFGRKSIKKGAAVAMASMLFATKLKFQKQVRMLLKSMKRFLE